MDEQRLIEAAQDQDIESFNQLVLAYQDMAFSVAYRIIGEPDAAADATQEAFLSAYRKLYQFRGGSFKSWLMRIVSNACYDELRRRQRRPAASYDDLQENAPQFELSLADAQENPEQLAQRHELSRAIQDCLNELSDTHRVITVLSDIEGYPYQEIAEILGVPVGTIKSRLSRARSNLRACLQGVKELLPALYRLVDEE